MSEPSAPWMTSARASWLAEATEWIQKSLASIGLGAGAEITSLRERPWGVVLRVAVPGRVMFFKAEGPRARHEPVLVDDISRRWPALVPDVVAADLERAWLLMDDCGSPMRGSLDAPDQVRFFEEIVPIYGEMQRGSRSLARRWISAGVPDRRLEHMPHLIEALLAGELSSARLPLDAEQRRGIEATLPRLASVCDELNGTSFAEAIDHSDMHDGNVLIGAGRPRLVDWGDACITHPFTSLFVTLQHAVARLTPADRLPAALRLRDAYLEAWNPDAPARELRSAFATATLLGHLVRALNFVHQLDGSEMGNWPADVVRFLLRWREQSELIGQDDYLIEVIANQTEY